MTNHTLPNASVEIFDTPPPRRYDPFRDLLLRLRPGQWIKAPHVTAKQLQKTAASAGLRVVCQPISETESSVQIFSTDQIGDSLSSWRAARAKTDPRDAWYGTAVDLLGEMWMTDAIDRRMAPRTFGKQLSQLALSPESGVSIERVSKRGNYYRIAFQRPEAASTADSAL